MTRLGLMLGAGIASCMVLTGCDKRATESGPEAPAADTAAAFEDAPNDGSILCPGNPICPLEGDYQYGGVIVPEAVANEEQDVARIRTVVPDPEDELETRTGRPKDPKQIVCVAGSTENHAACPKGNWEGRLWRPVKQQITCYPGTNDGRCPTSAFAFLCTRNPENPFFGLDCPGVPQPVAAPAAGDQRPAAAQ